ncbi:hypothetical protein PGT21_014055 [Puccinia graminis f. sp. tritici]|uniref:Uncharacterized protein n=1 Tax=Puccinia graminis f. sp. tritici TaxID=56615 RepID=A0A5B0LMD3_PUCGR|nr:hypothetical protein PGT21_014055 [Puccinia graminis f. sp. tritici]
MAEVEIASHDLMTKETGRTEPKQETTSHTLSVPAPMRIKASSASNRFVLEGTPTQTPPKPPPVVILDLGSYPRGHQLVFADLMDKRFKRCASIKLFIEHLPSVIGGDTGVG